MLFIQHFLPNFHFSSFCRVEGKESSKRSKSSLGMTKLTLEEGSICEVILFFSSRAWNEA
ncbi:hypothetical protein ES319_D07G125600v1 [Gossypium barbadense]|uniref:Uncharacterized protein n=2 Tax=Gossypium TaxID=3633 RepID=A0A5J5QQ09_GOSBA|nr:hypothetical protein ES319_D07G125600v1 [Gossypium barbadense]TYG61254.1 hypothetical protein ES288_D07G132800v1 [Gossypium darwinii]